MKAFVTGSTGFLGSNLIQALLERGYEVKALVRSKAKAQKILGGLNIEIIEGDLDNVAGFTDALQGCDALFHTRRPTSANTTRRATTGRPSRN
jgi:dihydroflavonol-4-reductase